MQILKSKISVLWVDHLGCVLLNRLWYVLLCLVERSYPFVGVCLVRMACAYYEARFFRDRTHIAPLLIDDGKQHSTHADDGETRYSTYATGNEARSLTCPVDERDIQCTSRCVTSKCITIDMKSKLQESSLFLIQYFLIFLSNEMIDTNIQIYFYLFLQITNN